MNSSISVTRAPENSQDSHFYGQWFINIGLNMEMLKIWKLIFLTNLGDFKMLNCALTCQRKWISQSWRMSPSECDTIFSRFTNVGYGTECTCHERNDPGYRIIWKFLLIGCHMMLKLKMKRHCHFNKYIYLITVYSDPHIALYYMSQPCLNRMLANPCVIIFVNDC